MRLERPTIHMDLAGLRDYMAEHFNEPLSIGQLAELTGLRPKYFVDLFKKTYGQSAMDYLTALRIERAKRYLRETDYLLREIAQLVGYNDEFYFSRKFKKEVGVAPSAFARQTARRIASCSAAATGQLLALGVIPVAAPLDSKWTAYYYNIYFDRIQVHLKLDGSRLEAEFGKLLQARPDVVIGHDPLPGDWRPQLERYAQTVYVPQETDSWDGQLRELARYLGRERQGDDWLLAHERKVRDARRNVADAVGDATCIVLRLCGTDLHAYCNRGIRDVLYRKLALRPAYAHQESLYNERITLDELLQLQPQRILMIICPDSDTRVGWLSLRHSEDWRQLHAVQAGRVDLLPSDPWFEYSAIAVERMLEEASLIFTGKCPNADQDGVHGAADRFPV